MATIKKTITGLKPATNYLFSLKPKNTEISAIDTIPDTIRVQTPGVVSSPSTITGLLLAANFKSAMLRFNHATMVDLDYYEYKIYLASDGTETALKAKASTIDGAMVSGITKSNLVVISDLDNTTLVGSTLTTLSYRAKVRAVNTAGNVGAFSAASASADTQLIEGQFIENLTAGKIQAGTIGAHEIILTQPGTQTSYTPPNGTAVLRSSNYVTGGVGVGAGWIIKGDGTAEFDAASIRGTLSANAIFINGNNRWARNSANSAANSEFVVGDATNQLSFNPTGGATSGSLLKVGNSSNFMKFDNGVLTVTGAITTNANITGSTAGGLTIGTNTLQFQGTGYKNSAFFVGHNTDDGVTANKFSIGSKLHYDGTTLRIDGTVTIDGTTASIVVGNATTGAGDPATRINAGSTTIAGGKIRTGLIESTGFDWPNTATTFSSVGTRIDLDNGQIVSKNFRIDSSGNATFGGTVSGAAISGGTISGTTITTLSGGTISGTTISGTTINASVMQNAASSPTFKVDTSGNVFANNINATGSGAGDRRFDHSF